jgi:hypothetical protein
MIWFIAFLIVALPSLAAPPPGTDLDGALHAWFEHQHSIIGTWCCNVAGGHILAASDWRTSGGVQIQRAMLLFGGHGSEMRS